MAIAKKTSAPVKKSPFAPRDPNAPKPKLTAEQKERRKAALAKAALRQHEAPSDMKPFFLELTFVTAKDGLVQPKFAANRVRGRWDNEDAKRFDMLQYDPITVTAFIARLSAMWFATNPERRLSPDTNFHVVYRVAANKATGNLVCRFVAAKRTIVKSTGKVAWAWFDREKHKTNLDFKKLKRSVQNAAGAFTNVQLPPAGRQPKASAE